MSVFESPAFTLVKSSGVYAGEKQRRLRRCAYRTHRYAGVYYAGMILVANYRMEHDKDKQVVYIQTDERLICPVCACDKFISKGWRARKLILINDDVTVLMVRRVLCKGCNKIHHVLPDIIVPYKRHDVETIETIISGNKNGTICDDSVINRVNAWWRKLLSYIAMIEKSFQLQIAVPPKFKLFQTIRALAHINLWPRTRTALGIG